jgi:tagatose 1,6-diphosphate aldolase
MFGRKSRSFQFQDPGTLIEGELMLSLRKKDPGDPGRNLSPSYTFSMIHVPTGRKMGSISLRVGHSRHLTHYAGHIGYGVDEEFRGHRYAARSCRLLLPLAKAHGLDPLWITVNPDNLPSRRTCEILGADMVEIVDLPPDSNMYQQGERQKCRYKVDLGDI